MRWRSLAVLWLTLLVGCLDHPGGNDPADGGVDDLAISPTPDLAIGAEDGGGGTNILPVGVTASWSERSCSMTITYRNEGAPTSVKLAGDFTDWGTGALDMASVGAATFSITLAPLPNLAPGTLHAYKFIVDGNWVLDEHAPYRKFDGEFVNSAFLMPDCEGGPEIRTGRMTTTWEGTAGSAAVHLAIAVATDGAPPVEVLATLDGNPLPAGSVTFDATNGSFDLSFPELAAGKHRLALRAADASQRAAMPVDLPFWIEPASFDYRDGPLYMIMLDRYANGDRTNDSSAGMGNDGYPGDWHGGDLQGALAVLESGYFERLGVRTIWLSPVNQQIDGAWAGRPGDYHQYAGYHGYWPIKAREVDARIGGDAALRAFVDEAHRRGIRVLIDLINNQVHQQHEYVTAHPEWFRDTLPPDPAADTCICGTGGCGWSDVPFTCLFNDYLPDINWRVPGAEAQFIDDAIYWLSEFDLDGFRVDAVKHVEPNAIFNLRAALARRFEQGGARIFLVGETAVGEGDTYNFFGQQFANGYEWVDSYIGANALDGQFDFPSFNKLGGFLGGSMTYNAFETNVVRQFEERYKAFGTNVRFLGAQDSARMASGAANDTAAGCKWAADCTLPPAEYNDTDTGPYAYTYPLMKRALTILFTLPGIPFLYMGDEIATPGGNDPDNRRDMLWSDDLANLWVPGGTPPALSLARRDLLAWATSLGQARAASLALRRGLRVPIYTSDENLYVYGYVYPDVANRTDVALVVVNRGGPVNSRSVGTFDRGSGVLDQSVAAAGAAADFSGNALTVSIGAGESAVFYHAQ